jgi:hypothetical protein
LNAVRCNPCWTFSDKNSSLQIRSSIAVIAVWVALKIKGREWKGQNQHNFDRTAEIKDEKVFFLLFCRKCAGW